MFKFIASLLFSSLLVSSSAQEYTSSSIFAHNDYVHPVPFYTSYQEQVGFIEADVFLESHQLMVAHSKEEIKQGKTLTELYLKPLQKKIIENKGFVYTDHDKPLTLMIDLKTEGVTTLNELTVELKKFPELLSCTTLQIAISGNVPDGSLWNNYPDFIHFDGRPNVAYTDDQLKRISLISTNFRNHSQWNGKDVLTKTEEAKMTSVIDAVHAQGKKIRFWNAPDFPEAWLMWMKLKVDIIGTDNVLELSEFIKGR